MSIEEETLKTILSGVYNNSFFHDDGMTFEQAMALMRQGKKVTRPKWGGTALRMVIRENDRKPCFVKDIPVRSGDGETRVRTYFFATIASADILATDWEVCDGSAV